jgi:hypothetical protein
VRCASTDLLTVVEAEGVLALQHSQHVKALGCIQVQQQLGLIQLRGAANKLQRQLSLVEQVAAADKIEGRTQTAAGEKHVSNSKVPHARSDCTGAAVNGKFAGTDLPCCAEQHAHTIKH